MTALTHTRINDDPHARRTAALSAISAKTWKDRP